MLSCSTRGFSFTRALLGIAADELHLCGDPAAIAIIQEILKATEDEVEVFQLFFIYDCKLYTSNRWPSHNVILTG